jgi:hypothetical protein
MQRIIPTALVSGVLIAVSPAVVLGEAIPKKGATSYVTHFVFHPLASIDVPGVGKATSLEAVGPTDNMKGEKMLDKMKAKCTAVSIESGGKQYIDGACALTDSDGDIVFSTFDTRDLDKSQPEMDGIAPGFVEVDEAGIFRERCYAASAFGSTRCVTT